MMGPAQAFVTRAVPHARWLGPAIVLVLMAASLVSQARAGHPCALDEPGWITSGYRTFQLVSEVAPPSRWENAYDELSLGDWGNKNPPVAKLLFGLVIAATIEDGERVEYRWQRPLSHRDNHLHGNLPPSRLLTPVRTVVAVCGGILLIALFFAALLITSRPWLSLVAPGMVFAMPVFVWHASHVYTDVPQLMFLAIGLAAFTWYLRTWRLRALVLAGIALGLSCAVKFSSAPLLVACCAATTALGPVSWRHRAGRAIALGGLAASVFVAVNPYLYPNPVARVRTTIAAWDDSKRAQQQDPFLARMAVKNAARGIERTLRGAVVAPHESYSRGLDLVAPRLISGLCIIALAVALMRARFRAIAMRRREWAPFVAVLLWLLLLAVVVLDAPLNVYNILAGVAIAYLAAGSREARRPRLFLSLALGTMFLMTALWLPFDWARYYLPVIVVLAVVQAAGIAGAARFFEPEA